jgi:asparagine synthase (glutamine-hydrolysing)
MCGIAGIYHHQLNPVNEVELRNMGNAIFHRGPDDQGVWCSNEIGFAHQRLSIIDTSSAGHQPMHTPDGRYTIVFNGEIYNHNEFRAELKNKGVVFHSNSDTEVLLYLYIHYGSKMLDRLNGMFAFAIWDNEKKELFLARDRYGVKPLYYINNSIGFYFASEPKALFANGIKKRVDNSQINEWLMFRYIAGESTLLDGVKKLLPGHHLTLRRSRPIQLTRWYNLGEKIRNHEEIKNPTEWFASTFHDSVKYRMVADVPVGVLLSGGLDSSSVTASLHKSGFKDISTFNIGFRDYIHDESGIAKRFSDSLNYPFHSIYLEGHELYETLNKSVFHLDEPLTHLNDPQIMAISTHAKQYVKVLLSGEGADEMMGGYVRYKTFKYVNFRTHISFILNHTPEKYKNQRLKKLERYLKVGGVNQLILGNACNLFESDFDKLGLSYMGISSDYRAKVLQEAKTVYPNDPTKQLLYYDQHTYLQSLNDRNDRATMAAGIECREPFQDYRLMEGLGTLDKDWLTKGKKGKYILKKSMHALLPDYITNFRKVGLSVPWIDLILKSDELRAQWNDFASQKSFDNDLLDKINIKPLIKGITNGQRSEYDSLVLQYFMYYIWNRSYLN